jgi:hypothetical protein
MARSMTSTTAAAAITNTAHSFDVASVSGIEVNDILIVDREPMSVLAIVGVRLDVQRGIAGGAVAAHAAGAKVWHGQPGDFYASVRNGVGDRNNELVLPRFVLGREGVIQQDIIDGEWVTIENLPRKAFREPVYDYTASGAIDVATGIVTLSGGILAMTLAAPTGDQEGTRMNIRSKSAHAHTVTFTGGLNGAGASQDVGTFGGAIGDGIELIAVNLVWQIVANRNVTVA